MIKNIKGPLPQVRIMPTGGVNAANAGEWIAAGAVAVGAGGDLTAERKPAIMNPLRGLPRKWWQP